MANLARLHEFGHRLERFLDRNLVPLAQAPVGRAARAPERQRTIGPVQLIEIDIVGAQPLQGALDRIGDVLAVQDRALAIGPHPVGVAAARDFGGDDDPVAVPARRKP